MGWIPRIVVPIARSLRKNGVPVDVADFALGPPIRSRAIRQFKWIPRPDLARAQFVEQLTRFIREGGHDMLIPTDDQTLTAMMEHYDDFKDLLHIACPPPHIVRLVLDKTLTLDIARTCGIRVPKGHVIRNSAEMSELVDTFPFPWVIKPAEKETRIEETKSFTVATAQEIALRFPVAREFVPPMLLQEYCAGVGVGVEMLMHGGNCLAVFQHRRLKELPYTGGVSVTAIAERPHPALVESSMTLLRALRWQGVAMVEYKVADGCEPVLMEVNGRYWGTISLPISAGMDFPLYHWQVIHGEQPEIPCAYAAGTKWRWTVGYFLRLYSLLVRARNTPEARQALSDTLPDVPRDFSPKVFDATFDLADPAPTLVGFFHAVKYVFSYSVGRLTKRKTS